MPYPIRLHAKERLAYFTPPQSFNLLGMLSSPMVLMTVFGGGMVLAMPYIMVCPYAPYLSSSAQSLGHRKTWTLNSWKISKRNRPKFLECRMLLAVETLDRGTIQPSLMCVG